MSIYYLLPLLLPVLSGARLYPGSGQRPGPYAAQHLFPASEDCFYAPRDAEHRPGRHELLLEWAAVQGPPTVAQRVWTAWAEEKIQEVEAVGFCKNKVRPPELDCDSPCIYIFIPELCPWTIVRRAVLCALQVINRFAPIWVYTLLMMKP